jgi:hypothetical protein
MERLAAGIRAGGASAVAAARDVAAQIAGAFPQSPAKWGPLSGKGDPLRSGGTIMQRLADGMRRNQAYLMRQLIPIMNATARVLRLPAIAPPTSGWSVTRSVPSELTPSAVRLLDTPSSAPHEWRGADRAQQTSWNANNGGIQAEDGSYVNPNFYNGGNKGVTAEDLRAALEGLTFRFEDDGRAGLAKLVNRQQRTLARR